MTASTSRQALPATPPHRRRHGVRGAAAVAVIAVFMLAATTWVRLETMAVRAPHHTTFRPAQAGQFVSLPQPAPPNPFDPGVGAILPTHRIVAFYAVPGVRITGPAYVLSAAMLANLRKQGAAYQKLDPKHPVVLGIDLVVSVPDRRPGDSGTYSHHVSPTVIRSYVDFCRTNKLQLFLDLNIGWANPLAELNFFRPYLELPFVNVAVDPEWMFPRHNGIPGVDLSNVRASDLNPLIEAVAAMPAEYHVPRKIMLIHQFRPDGDGLSQPTNPKVAEIADKRNLINDPRVDLVIHVDSVGGWPGDIRVKETQYARWVAADMARYHNFRYGGFKIFYFHESAVRLMTPAQVLALRPAPMVVTYGY